MALPKRKSRKITVNEQTYIWLLHFDKDEPWWSTVSVRLEGNTQNSVVYSRVFYDGAVTPAIVRRIIDTAIENDWDPNANKERETWLSEFESNCCFFGFPKLIMHDGNEYVCKLVEKGGLHMRIQRVDTSDAQALVTNCTLTIEQCNEALATAFIEAAIQSGWLPLRTCEEVFWLESDACAKVLTLFGSRKDNPARKEH